ncbi:MAG: efflux RND transporter permease subunit, partial [Myxococcales bacterium]
ENKPSVIELKRVAKRTAGISSLAIVIDGKNTEAMEQFSDALLPPLRALGPNWIGAAENGVHAEREFMKQRQALYLPVQKLRDIHDRIEERYQREIFGSIDDDDEPQEPLTKESIEREFAREAPKQSKGPPYRDGYYLNADGTRLVVLARTPVASGDLEHSKQLQQMVRDIIERTNPAAYDASINVGLTGDVVTSAEQYGVVKNDLTTVGVLGVSMIILIDFVFFLKLRAVLTMALAIGMGVLWTFGVTRFAIGHLNTASGFLVSIIFGNGINYGILLRARYGEARRADLDITEALELAYRDTLIPTLTVAAAAGAGYLSLASTNFRGFRDFGLIGGYGMLLCWIANYLLMPPLLVVFERVMPSFSNHTESLWGRIQRRFDQGVPFGAPFAWMTRSFPAVVTASVGGLLVAAAAFASYRYIKADPLEYNLGHLENDAAAVQSAATRLGVGMTDITGRTGQDGMAIMTERLDQVKPLLAELERRRLAGGAEPPFQKVVSIYDLVPDDQAEKVDLLHQIRERIEKVRAHGKISDQDWKDLQQYLPPSDLRPFGIEDLPEKIVRPFTERDGTRGRIVYVVPTEGKSVRDLRYLLKWANSYRNVTLPSGEVIWGSGRAVIYADMLSGVMEEGPRAALLAAVMTALVVIVAFSRGRHGVRATVLVLSALATGMLWMGGLLNWGHVKLNFLNFIAIPITLGIGVDYAINLVHRWRIQGKGQVPMIVRETGGAVILCSMTTCLGYLALMQSVNPAVRSFGLAAVIGEVTCLFAVVVVLPAVLLLLERRAPHEGVT